MKRSQRCVLLCLLSSFGSPAQAAIAACESDRDWGGPLPAVSNPHPSAGDTGAAEVRGDSGVLAIASVAPAVLDTVTSDCFVLTGDGFDLVAIVEFGSLMLSPGSPGSFGQGSYEIIDPHTLRICPPQCLQAGSYPITLHTAAGATAAIPVQLVDPLLPTLVCRPTHPAGTSQCLYVHVGNSPPPHLVFVLVSNSNVPSVIPGLIHAGLGEHFTNYYCGPGVMGECIEYCFAVPLAVAGQTYYFQSITWNPFVATLPLPVTGVCSTTYDAVSTICGYKFFDHNEDQIWNPGSDPLEVPIAGWRVELWSGSVLVDVTFTNAAGRYCFVRPLDQAVYTVQEVAPGGFIGDGVPGAVWLATTPRSGTVVANATNVAGPDFGNLSFEVKTGVGRTKGFWHNNNGQALLAGCDPDWRHDLYVRNNLPVCLRTNVESADPALSLFLPPFPQLGSPSPAFFALAFGDAHQALADWLVARSLGHAGYQLSSQVAASILNNSCGFMQFTVYVDRHQNGILVSFEEMVAGATALLCDANAGLTGPGSPFPALRQAMLACTNEFGSINETGDPSSPQLVFGLSPTPKDFTTPY